MKPFLLWSKPHAAIAQYLERSPDDFTVIDTDHVQELQKLYKLRRDSPVFDPFPRHGTHYRDVLEHLTTVGCRYHVVGLDACREVLRRLNDPSLSNASFEEILLVSVPSRKSRPHNLHSSPGVSPPTIFLSRLIGLFLIVVCLAMLMQKQTMVEIADAILADRPLMLVLGLIALVAGLAIVLLHNVWSGGALPVVVTLCGWVILMRGVLLLFVPPDVMLRLWSVLRFDEWLYVYAGLVMALGLYLTYAGFESTLAGFTARMRSIARRE